jgi:hypothetical protein
MSRMDGDDLAQTAERILAVDAKRIGNDPFLLPVELRTLLQTRLSNYREEAQNHSTASGMRSGHSAESKEAITALRERVRDGYRFLDALPTFQIPASQKLSVMQVYGFDGGKIGNLLRKDRVLALARLAVSVTPSVLPSQARYSVDLLSELTRLLDILADAEPGSLVGNRAVATKARDAALVNLYKALRRVRHYFCSCSDDVDTTPELTRVGINSVKRSGQRKTKAETAVKPPEGPLPPVVAG